MELLHLVMPQVQGSNSNAGKINQAWSNNSQAYNTKAILPNKIIIYIPITLTDCGYQSKSMWYNVAAFLNKPTTALSSPIL